MSVHILPDAMLGILGGGQLGRMFTLAARAMGYRVSVLDPDPDCPAGNLADAHLRAHYDDAAALHSLAATCAAVTTEFENVPAESLRLLQQTTRVRPSADCVSIAQDRICEKRYIAQTGIRVAPFVAVEIAADLARDLSAYLPGILKVARLGYDGKGQIRVETPDEARAAFLQMGCRACVLERRLTLKSEISVIVVRSSAGEAACFPVAENQHAAGILELTIVPARIAAEVAERARRLALQLATAMDYIGVLAVEFFIVDDDEIVINEIAPRPHNSGHYTLDACVASQFEQQVRALCGLPPACTRLLSPVVMVNLLGDFWRNDSPAWDRLLSQPNVKLHLYGKKTARIGRKMGHFNLLAEDVTQALVQARKLKQTLERC